MTDPIPKASRMRSVVREPTLHFALLAGALFAVNALVGARSRENVIEIDRGEIAARIAEIEARTGATLPDEERKQVEEAYIDERVLVREAQALGLEHDARIHDFLAQKMLHVLSADVIQPADDELEAYYDAHRARYVAEPTVTIDELVIGTAGALPAALRDQLDHGAAPEQLVASVPIRHGVLTRITRAELTRVFGDTTTALILGAAAGAWVGPHHTVRGQHWFRVTERTAPAPPDLEAIREQVRLDWVMEQEEARLERRVAELRQRYVVEFTGAGAKR
jgi:hypothetical protein